MGTGSTAMGQVRTARPEDGAEISRISAANGQPRGNSGREPRYLAHLARHGQVMVIADAAGTGAATGTGETDGTGARLAGLRSGFRIDDFDHYMSTGEGLMHPGDVLSPALA